MPPRTLYVVTTLPNGFFDHRQRLEKPFSDFHIKSDAGKGLVQQRFLIRAVEPGPFEQAHHLCQKKGWGLSYAATHFFRSTEPERCSARTHQGSELNSQPQAEAVLCEIIALDLKTLPG